tara:strand:- start:5481 stop:6149 length:669 start_codon:yes stop_codon:yes gene_type:complete
MDPERGVIFDWDGVIIDSHDQHQQAWFRLADEMGKPMTPELFDQSFGMRNESCIPEVFQWAEQGDHARIREIGDRKEELYREVLRETGIEPLPGVVKLLEELRENRIPAAVGSSTSRLNILTVMEVANLAPLFVAISAAEDVDQGKPAPDVFLKAAEKMLREPEHCVVFEDAFVGLQAAKAAGMKRIAVATTHPLEALTDSDLAVRSLEDVNLATIDSLFAG